MTAEASIAVSLNNERRELEAALTVAEALARWEYRAEGVAVAINGEFLPRSRYAEQTLAEGDCLDVVAPVQGG